MFLLDFSQQLGREIKVVDINNQHFMSSCVLKIVSSMGNFFVVENDR